MTILSPTQRRRRNRQEMIDAILQVSREMMREEGAAALNLNEVARRVGVKTPSLYGYFDNKMAIYDALFKQGMEQFAEATAVPPGVTGWDHFAYALEAYMRFAVENPDLYQLLFERPVPGFEPSAESMAVSLATLERARADMSSFLAAAGIEPGLPAAQALDLTIAMAHGLTAQHMANEPHLGVGDGRYGGLIPQAVAVFKAAWGGSEEKQQQESDH
jgi:AcrR family transcriptional regulator